MGRMTIGVARLINVDQFSAIRAKDRFSMNVFVCHRGLKYEKSGGDNSTRVISDYVKKCTQKSAQTAASNCSYTISSFYRWLKKMTRDK